MSTTRTRLAVAKIITIVLFICTIGLVAQPSSAVASSHTSPQLTPNQIVKWDPAGGTGHTYSVAISSSNTKIIAVVVLSGSGFTPKIEIDDNAGCTVSGAANRAAVLFCSDGTSGNYTVTVKKANGSNPDAAYAVMALNTNQSTGGGTVTGIQAGANRSLNPNKLDMFNITTSTSSVQNRTLSLTANKIVSNANTTTNLAFAVMFREDGTVSCNSWGSSNCDVFDTNNDNYHLLMFNADSVDITYTLELKS